MDVQSRSDRTTFTLILQTLMRPFKPRLVAPKKTFPAGSPRLTPNKKLKSLVRVIERQHQGTAIWPYDIASFRQDEAPKKEKLHMYYFAGGGWQSPPSGEHWKFCAELARKVPGLTVTIVSSPLAPNAPAASTFPVLRELYDSVLLGAESSGARLAFAGDSSGGNLALCLVLDGLGRREGHARSAGPPAAVLAISPAVDLRPMGEIGSLARRDPALTVGSHNSEARTWAGEVDPASPWLSPVLADVNALAHAGVRVIGVTGGYDILTPSALEFRDACMTSGVEGAWLQWERQMHCFPLAFTYRLPESVKAKDWVVEQLKTLGGMSGDRHDGA